MTAYADSLARPPRTLTEREVALILRITGQHASGWRDHVIVSLALGTGLREHEILALDIGDVFDEAHRPKRHVQLRVFKRASEDPPPQEIVLSETIRAKLEKLLRQKRADGHDLAAGAPLFVSRKRGRLSPRQLRHAFAVWQARAGFERAFGFHALRHTAITNLYRRTRDIRLAQRFARHRSILSTTIYTHPTDEELVRSVQELPC
jgi:site-specific recombinase XerD